MCASQAEVTTKRKWTKRTATVGERFRQFRRRNSVVPQIRLAGLWLTDAGFNIGDKLNVKVDQQEIYITRASP
jgi:Toxin SymE, type I toxin-antitoxin system